MTIQEISKKVNSILEQNEKENVKRCTVTQLEAIMVTLSLNYAEELLEVVVNDTVGTETYESINSFDLLQETINMNYTLFGEKEVKLNLIDKTFIETSESFWMHYIMETAISVLVQMPKSSPNLYQRMQILVAEQLVVEEKVHNSLMKSPLDILYKKYMQVMDTCLHNLKLDDDKVDYDSTVYTKEEVILDLKFGAVADYLAKHSGELQIPIADYVENLGEIGMYEIARIMNYSAVLFLSYRYNVNVLDLRNFIKEHSN